MPMPPPPLGRYREFQILEEIGEGAFARVYKVRAPGFDRPMALKLATGRRMSPDMIKRAIREIAVLRSMTNPHVVKLHGSSVGEDHFYVLMDYLQGRQLDAYHDFDQPMGAGEALSIMLQACIGLAEAHAEGVVHRDLKPANIWIEEDRTVKVIDFGLARAWDVPWAYGTNATAGRTVVGTPHYCQPEQVHTDQLTPASDVYSLTTMLYELLSGRAVLFEHQSVSEVVEALHDNPVAWLDAHVQREPVPITRYPGCGGLPDRLLALLDRGLAKDPAARPQTAGEMASALGTILVEDIAAVQPAVLEVIGDRGVQTHRLLPGRRSIGASAEADVCVEGEGLDPVHIVIDWSGSPRHAQIRPATRAAKVEHNAEPLPGPITIEPGDVFTAGSGSFVIRYP